MADSLPSTTKYVAIAMLGMVALLGLVSVVGGLAMQAELWSPGALWSAQFYSRMLGVHQLVIVALGMPMLAGCLGYTAVGRLIGATRLPAPAIAWIGVGLCGIGVIASLITVVVSTDVTGWTLYTPQSLEQPGPSILPRIAPIAFLGAGLVFAIHIATLLGANARGVASRQLAVAVAVVVVIGIAALGAVFESFATFPRYLPWTLLALAVALASVALAGDGDGTRGTLALIAIGLGVVWAFQPLNHVIPPLLLGLALLGVWIALAVIGGFRRPAVAFVLLGVGPAIVMHGIVMVLLRDAEVWLHDTHVEVGAMHLLGAVVGFSALATLHAWRIIARVPNAILMWGGAGACGAGVVFHAVSSMRLGGAGMPRRYWDYPPEFTAWHQLAMIGSIVIVIGLVMLAIAWLVGKPAKT